jgi:uncharacterized protein (TIGR02145 family)
MNQAMKNYLILIAAAVLAAGVSSCGEKVETPKPSLEFTTANPMQVGAAGGTFEVEIKSNTKWKVSGYSTNVSAVAPTSGEGDAKVSFTVADNFGGDARTETINFTIDDGSVSPAVTFSIAQAKGDLIYGGVTYRVAKMEDGRIWMQENLRYIPTGKTVSSDLANNTGVWYPVEFYYKNADMPAGGELKFLTGDADVAKYGYLYNFATASGLDLSKIALVDGKVTDLAQWEKTQGICPDGWYIPTAAEWTALVAAYPYTPEGGEPNNTRIGITDMVDMGFLAGPAGCVIMGNSLATPAFINLSYMFSSTIASYSVNATTSAITTMMKTLMQNRTYDNTTKEIKNDYFLVSDGSVYTGMPIRCIKAE